MNFETFLSTWTFAGVVCTVSSQRAWIPPTTTMAEMWDITTWVTPYAVALTEGVRDFLVKAQEIKNQLYLQAQAKNAFSWLLPWNWFKSSPPPSPSPPPGATDQGLQVVKPGSQGTGHNNLRPGMMVPTKRPGSYRPMPTLLPGRPNKVNVYDD